jgi:hypothetical protein
MKPINKSNDKSTHAPGRGSDKQHSNQTQRPKKGNTKTVQDNPGTQNTG